MPRATASDSQHARAEQRLGRSPDAGREGGKQRDEEHRLEVREVAADPRRQLEKEGDGKEAPPAPTLDEIGEGEHEEERPAQGCQRQHGLGKARQDPGEAQRHEA